MTGRWRNAALMVSPDCAGWRWEPMGADKDGVMASPNATVVIDWATFLAHLNREAFVRFGQMDGSFIGSLPPSEIETLLCDCTISDARWPPDAGPRRSAAEPSSEGARPTRGRRTEHERTSRYGVGGRGVRSHQDGVKPTTSNIGNTEVKPPTRTVSPYVPGITISCMPIPTGRSSGTRSPSESSETTAPKSVPPSNTPPPTSNPPNSTSPVRNDR